MEVDNNLVEEFKNLNKENIEFSKKCSKIAHEINSGQLTIVQLVEQLGGLLVDVAPINRELGTCVLTEVLEGLPPNHFDEKQLKFICAFYTDRLKDHHQVIPAVLRGVIALAKFEQFPDGAATQILAALFHNVACQQQQHKDRQNIYKIFDILLRKCATELCTMGMEYVYGVISAIDGERDPKNLVFLFNWCPKFLRTVNLGHLLEEAFEVLACYFPVDFKAPPQDPTTITRDKLADALAPCLTAIPQFAEFCFPLALEKLDSSLEIAKLDSLNLLQIGCLSFDTSSYVQHSTEIWSQIQKELFNSPSPEVESACLTTLSAVVKKISHDPSLGGTVKDIADTLKRNLLPDSRLFKPTSKLLLSVAQASQISSTLITKEIAPILINTFNITTTPSHKVVVLKVLVNFFDGYVQLHDVIEFEELNSVPFLSLKAALDENANLRSAGFDSLNQISQFLPLDVRISVYDTLQKLLLMPQVEEVRCSIRNCFEKLAENYSNEIKEKIIDSTEITNLTSLRLYLAALCVIAPQDYFTAHINDILLGYLSKDLSLGQVAINSLRNLLEKHEHSEKIQLVLIEKNIINTLVDWSIKQGDHIEKNCLENVAFILKSIIGCQCSERQRVIVDNELSKILNLPQKRQTYVLLVDGILCRLQRDVKINYNILNDLTEVALKEDCNFLRNVAVQLLANLINKCSDENVLQNYLNQFEDNHQNENNLIILAWITKALVMRNHERATAATNRLIAMLKDNQNVAACFRIIINDEYDALSKKSCCCKTLLYQQKFFNVVSSKLSENYQPGCTSYLMALGYLMEHTPRQAILMQFNKILKLVILCLDECQESEVLTVLLQVIKDFIAKKETCIEDHLQEFLTRLLRLSTFNKSMKVRILALQCLQQYISSFPVYKLLLCKQEVLRVLGKCIDDKKRFVRREAVEARTLWFLLDAPV